MSEKIKSEIAALIPRLRRFAYAITGNRDDGDDLVQTACVKALKRLDQYERGTRLDSWMFRIVQNAHIDALRKRSRQGVRVGPDVIDTIVDAREGTRRAEDRVLLARVREKIAELPIDQRVVVTLISIEGYTYREVADMLDLPIGTVMSRLSRARAQLLPLLREV